MNAAAFQESRPDPGKTASAALALAVHAALIILLVYGIRWQTRAPEAVEVELVRASAPPPAAVTPPMPEPAPEPVIKPGPKPDIAIKEEKPKVLPEPKPVPKPEPKPAPKPSTPKPSYADALNRELQDIEKQKADRELENIAAATTRAKAMTDYIGKIKGKIKGNIMLPPDIKGNPEAVFDVVQLPSGEILSVKLKQSSGHAAYDDAIERAIRKSSPLPKPEDKALFERSLTLKFRPQEE
ncbi:MAG: TonB C-terminal domain-containing protein [Zoogloeaceae bacterium]|jgi:colicin import membrane protein|nr:TonB C-terminal domain-containing protein [Zoogloeaceae bacterium]